MDSSTDNNTFSDICSESDQLLFETNPQCSNEDVMKTNVIEIRKKSKYTKHILNGILLYYDYAIRCRKELIDVIPPKYYKEHAHIIENINYDISCLQKQQQMHIDMLNEISKKR